VELVAKKLTTMLMIILVQQNLGNVFLTICTYPWRNGEILTSVNTLFNTTIDSFQMFTNPMINGTHNTWYHCDMLVIQQNKSNLHLCFLLIFFQLENVKDYVLSCLINQCICGFGIFLVDTNICDEVWGNWCINTKMRCSSLA
jgi:hypothetical protein